MENKMASSPLIRAIPAELLSEIFIHCVEGGMDEVNTIQTPLLVAAICSRWRDAAISTPRLWSRLFLQLSCAMESQSALVDAWLARSSGHSLTVYVFLEDPLMDSHPVLDVLVKHSRRWEGMFFYMPIAAFGQLTAARGNLPRLAELSLGSGDDPSAVSSSEIMTTFENSPKLRSLECVNLSPFIFKFPWVQLHEIPMMAVTINEGLGILRRSSLLDTAGFIFLDGISRISLLPVNHTQLRNFTIMTPPWNEHIGLGTLFTHLTLPNLEKLTICNLKSTLGPTFITFLSRLTSLETLHLRKTEIKDRELIRSLAALPSLMCLILHPSPNGVNAITNDFFEALTWKDSVAREQDVDNSHLLAPKLQKLEIQIDESVAESFIAMVQSRRMLLNSVQESPGVADLESIRVRMDGEIDKEIVSKLDALRLDGLAIDIEDVS